MSNEAQMLSYLPLLQKTQKITKKNLIIHNSDAGTGARGATAPQIFDRIESSGDIGGTPHYYLPPNIFHLPASLHNVLNQHF